MKVITVHLPKPYIKALDKLVDDKYYPNRAEAIRVAVRDLLNDEAWNRPFELKIDIEAKKIYELTKLFHSWNRREVASDKAMLTISKIFDRDIHAEDKRIKLLEQSVPIQTVKTRRAKGGSHNDTA